MKRIFKTFWKYLVLFWTIIGAFVFFSSLVLLVVTLQSSQNNFISPAEFCEKNPVGAGFKAIEISAKIHNVKNISARLTSVLGPVDWSHKNNSKDGRERAESILNEIDKLGLNASFRITDTLGFLKRTCEIEFEKGHILKSNYSTWD